ncbi:MAG: hypothetical protein HYX92_20390 [Chloroflexi bacterium]|nr:hypothetical protein [Chloroflexota bacterium]
MNISEQLRKLLVDEIRFVVQKMKASPDAGTKSYFFSAVHGAANRVSNIEFDPEVAFINFVLNSAFQNINARIAAMAQRQETGIGVPEGLFDKLEDALEDLRGRIERDEKTYPALERIATLAFTTTGNGYYLYSKGVIKV